MNLEDVLDQLNHDQTLQLFKMTVHSLSAEEVTTTLVELLSPADLDELIVQAENKITDAFEQRGDEVPRCAECGRME